MNRASVPMQTKNAPGKKSKFKPTKAKKKPNKGLKKLMSKLKKGSPLLKSLQKDKMMGMGKAKTSKKI